MTFEEALKEVKSGEAIRLPKWNKDVYIVAQIPDDLSKMTHPYLYVESRFGKVPWLPTQVELFATNWTVITLTS